MGQHPPREEAFEMAYPEPITPVKGKAAAAFLAQLDNFKLTAKQKRLFRGAKKAYLESNDKP